MWESRFDMSLLPMICMEEICNCLRPCNAGKHWNQLSDKGRHHVCVGGGDSRAVWSLRWEVKPAIFLSAA